jgi:capsid protein
MVKSVIEAAICPYSAQKANCYKAQERQAQHQQKVVSACTGCVFKCVLSVCTVSRASSFLVQVVGRIFVCAA